MKGVSAHPIALSLAILACLPVSSHPGGQKDQAESTPESDPAPSNPGALRQWWEDQKEQSQEQQADLRDRYHRWKDKWFGDGSGTSDESSGATPRTGTAPIGRPLGKSGALGGPPGMTAPVNGSGVTGGTPGEPTGGESAITQGGGKAFQKALGNISAFNDPGKLAELENSQAPAKGGDAAAGGNPGGGAGNRLAGGGGPPPSARDAEAPSRQAQDWLRGGVPGLDPANPKTEQDLAMAALSGFKAPFERLGLRAGPGGGASLQRKDGTPATPEDMERLRSAILAEPQALMKYPGFFSVLPREAFHDLKVEYRSDEEARRADFKHILLTDDDRDFKWFQSCSKVSGDCNSHAGGTSYSAGEFVPPDDLDRIWQDQAQGRLDVGAEEAHAKLSRKLLSDADKGGILSGLLGLADSVKSWFSGEEAGAPAGEAGAEGGGSGATAAVFAGGGGQVATVPRSGAGPGRERARPGRLLGAQPSRRAGGRPRRGLWLIAALLGAGMVGFGLYKKKQE